MDNGLALSRPSRPSFGSAAMPGHLSSTEVKTDEEWSAALAVDYGLRPWGRS
jgi:hypothetical protein